MKRVAVFDFDDTLAYGDSFMPFLVYAVGFKAYAVLALAVVSYPLHRLRVRPCDSLRTHVKGFLLQRLLKGKRKVDLACATEKICAWRKPNTSMMTALHEHKEKGDIIIVASGSLDLYLPEMLHDVPHDVLICTEIGIENGICTGEMIQGNCVRARKAERIKQWLETHGPFDESFGYGNYPHDVPMLSLVTHRVIVS